MSQSQNYVPPRSSGNWYMRIALCGAVLGVILALMV